jgi:hypothetical protein
MSTWCLSRVPPHQILIAQPNANDFHSHCLNSKVYTRRSQLSLSLSWLHKVAICLAFSKRFLLIVTKHIIACQRFWWKLIYLSFKNTSKLFLASVSEKLVETLALYYVLTSCFAGDLIIILTSVIRVFVESYWDYTNILSYCYNFILFWKDISFSWLN